jgi:hypothetical protein
VFLKLCVLFCVCVCVCVCVCCVVLTLWPQLVAKQRPDTLFREAEPLLAFISAFVAYYGEMYLERLLVSPALCAVGWPLIPLLGDELCACRNDCGCVFSVFHFLCLCVCVFSAFHGHLSLALSCGFDTGHLHRRALTTGSRWTSPMYARAY